MRATEMESAAAMNATRPVITMDQLQPAARPEAYNSPIDYLDGR